jgi:phosphatidylserine/phosphatidylglycerophosphate/cardiolipin synthase-like enzyme
LPRHQPEEATTTRGSWLAGLVGAAIGALAAEGAARLGLVLPDRHGTLPIAGLGTATLCFTPPEDCTALIRRELAAAGRQVLVQAYSFTSAPIAEALVAARRRGVEVTVLLDGDSAEGPASVLGSLTRGGVRVLLDDPPGIAHNKVMVIDGARVITGSFNFSRAAEERNAENLLVLRDEAIAAAYAANWARREALSRPAARR